MSKALRIIVSVILFSLFAVSDEYYPKHSAWDKPDPDASADAEQGGILREYLGPSPKSLNAYLDSSFQAFRVMGFLYESLLEMGQDLNFDRAIAYKWSISDDKKTFTFWIDPKARWSDGKPITAQDVKWTFDALRDPKNMTGVFKLALERFENMEIIDGGKAVRCVAKDIHWENLQAIGDLLVLPKHAFGNMDFNKINFEFPVVSGPYRIRELKEGKYLSLERRQDWWRQSWPSAQNKYNFDELRFLFFEDQNNGFDALMKGEVDVMMIYSARQWEKIEVNREKVRKNWIVKQAIHSKSPVGFQGFAMNMRKPPFDDLRVRQAMAHLIDREYLNSSMMFNQYFMHKSYYEDLYDKKHPCKNPYYDFNVEKACALLDAAGWHVNPETGKREKDGKPLQFTFLERDSSSARIITTFKTQLEKVGIDMTIATKDWSAWAKDMDDFNFDMTWCAWGGSLFKNPEYAWLSTEAERTGGNNYTGFKDKIVDELIKQQREIFEAEKRHEICRTIDARIYAQCPYVLLWNIDYVRLLYWNRFGTPKSVLAKYSQSSYLTHWWLDEDTDAFLEDAMKNNSSLPPKPATVIVE